MVVQGTLYQSKRADAAPNHVARIVMSIKTIALSAALSIAAIGSTSAATVNVDSKLNSSNTGNGAVTSLTLTAGQIFTVTNKRPHYIFIVPLQRIQV